MSSPRDPRDPRPQPSNQQEISAAAERAREQLRDEFEQLRAGIEKIQAEQSGGDAQPVASGFLRRARASFAVLALTTAVAAAAVNFVLNEGRSPKSGSFAGPSPSPPEPSTGGLLAGGGDAVEREGALLAQLAPGLQSGVFPPSADLPARALPATGPSRLFVVGDLVAVSRKARPGQDVAGGGPVHSPATAAPPPAPEAPQQFAFSPPPPPGEGSAGGGPGGGPGGDGPGRGDGPGKGGGPGNGGGERRPSSVHGGGGKGLGKGHIKGRGKGHGGSPGRGHEKDQGGGEVAGGSPDSARGTGGRAGGRGNPGRGHRRGGGQSGKAPAGGRGSHSDGNPGKGHGVGSGRSGSPAPAPAAPNPASRRSGSNGNGGGNGHGRSAAPGQSGK